MRTRARIKIAGLVLGAALVGGAAWATTADGPVVYTACKLDALGTIRLINPSLGQSSLLGHCTKFETQISWNQAGAAGAAGPVGPKGPAGVAGPGGAAGPKGDTGFTGPAGPAGADGKPGAKGDPCLSSDPACVGAKGDPGTPGSNGWNGADGANGTNGEAGPKGDPCLPDVKGCQGPKGDTGAQGATGPQGPPGSAAGTTSTVTTLAHQAFGEPAVTVPLTTSPEFGSIVASCEASGSNAATLGVLINVYVDTSTASAGRFFISEGFGAGRYPTATLRIKIAQAQFGSPLAPQTFTGSDSTMLRFATAPDGSPTFASEHISVGSEILPDSSCRISITTDG